MVSKPTLKVMTGGQTGVDTGALLAVIAHHETNGVLLPPDVLFPQGMKREAPEKGKIDAKKLAKLVSDSGGGAYCTDSPDYNHRTREVIRRTQACLIITPELDATPGTRLTYKVASDAGHQLWLFRSIADKALWRAEGHAVGYWLKSLLPHWKVDGRDGINLMVAGPRGGKWPEAERVTGEIMNHVLEELKSR